MNNDIIFYLARHGQTEWNIAHRIQGQCDSDLTEIGKAQSIQLAEACMPLKISKVCTSSLGRALQTASLCANKLQVEVQKIAGFEERHFGCWQGKLTSEVNKHADYDEITSEITDIKPKFGESAKASLMRFRSALVQCLEVDQNETLLIITHGDILRCFMASFQTNEQTITGYDYKNAALIALVYHTKNQTFSTL